ncbi:M48 family metalloprotease [Agitococcus lubricus]|uniref:Putative Zn-dependent protease n=1 Tax=Agitococcus lubricus TaxID=1077255 RepID=A0A2T5IWI9_9GAMM|nr:M48 family metalloprotease [Agitococcus lubricus]PTQ88257.1 putative Zn-dependent protease [Agitococcus lubricus]
MWRQYASLTLLLGMIHTPSYGAEHTHNVDNLPDLATFSVNNATEFALGRQFLRQLRSSTVLREDMLLTSYLENLCYRLAFAAGVNQPNLQVVLIPDHKINAFAVAGGIIGVNDGLIVYADHEAELASVLAHELAHISQHHYVRSVEGASDQALIYLAALLASIALSSVDSEAGVALGVSTQAALAQQQLSYSRIHEREADRIGMQTLVSAGFSARAMSDFFSKMEKQTRQVGFMPAFLLTHPLTQERIADSSLRARSYTQQGQIDSLDYQLFRTRLFAQMGTDSQDIHNLQEKLTQQPQDSLIRYRLVLAYLHSQQTDLAEQNLRPLLKESPNQVHYLITQADIYLAAQKPELAWQFLQQALLVNNGSMVLRFYAAKAAQRTQKTALAIDLLEALSQERREDPLIWRSLMECYQQQKDALGVLRARAEYTFLQGDGKRALVDLAQAAEMAKTNYPVLAKIQQRQQAIQNIMIAEKK